LREKQLRAALSLVNRDAMPTRENIRALLEATFPETRFSVRKFRSSWRGTAWGIRWTGGPSEHEVQPLADAMKLAIWSFALARREARTSGPIFDEPPFVQKIILKPCLDTPQRPTACLG
jgi:hypothetical protein